MPDHSNSRKFAGTAVTRLPYRDVARQLVGAPWGKVEVPGGRLAHSSKLTPGAWSVSSLLVRGDTDILIYADSFDVDGEEIFCLKFSRSTDDWCRSHLQSAHPAFAPVLEWPQDIEVPSEFMEVGPDSAEMGICRPLHDVKHENTESVVPVVWYFLHASKTGLLLFADSEVPLNVGIADLRTADSIRSSLKAVSVISI